MKGIFILLILSVFLLACFPPTDAFKSLALGVSSEFLAEQIHLSASDEPDSMMVTWSSMQLDHQGSKSRKVYYKVCNNDDDALLFVDSSAVKFVDNGTLHHTQYIHRALLTELQLDEDYCYRVGNSFEYSFHTMKGDWEWKDPSFFVYGDFGYQNPRSLTQLWKETTSHRADVLVHNGDFAYDMFRDNATLGDRWFNLIEPIAAQVPYMTSIGNHEGLYYALNYRQRFSMPNYSQSQNLWFSWNTGNAHWISFNTELYFTYEARKDDHGFDFDFGPYPDWAREQLAFIELDLIDANKHRKERPWIFVFGHRPMYCSNTDDEECYKYENAWKKELETVFYAHGVDIIFEAHMHSYERLWPIYRDQVHNGTYEEPYTNYKAPVHIITGAAGCDERLEAFERGALGDWSAFRSSTYGFGHLDIRNDTTLRFEQVHAADGTVIDEIVLHKDRLSYQHYDEHAPPTQPVVSATAGKSPSSSSSSSSPPFSVGSSIERMESDEKTVSIEIE